MPIYTHKPTKIVAEEYTEESQSPNFGLVDKIHKKATGENVIPKGFNDAGRHRFLDDSKHFFTKDDLKKRLDKKHIHYDKNRPLELVAFVDLPGGRKFIEKGDYLIKDEDDKLIIDVVDKASFEELYQLKK